MVPGESSAMIPLGIKRAFTEEQSEQRKNNNMAVGGAGKVKGAEMPEVQTRKVSSPHRKAELPSNQVLSHAVTDM